ncbi:organic solute transporter subunit alpha-like isoform X2 [Amphiura filiformis]|uniref:organic solute transporter subunit alpha-like isoform X2 n=1 Tax=Amphiura filiformis TaxID=82378 RepID=UPI003B21AE35
MGDNMMMNGNTLPPSPCANMTLTPNSIEMVELMSSSQWTLALLIVCSILAGACLLIYVETIMFILLRLPYGTRRGFLIFLLGCFPVFSLTSILSIYFPRATLMAEFAASAYLAVCVYTFILLIVNYFGGYENMLKILHEERFSLAQAPCCCCRCLPEVALTKKTFHRARIMVMQMTVVRPVALFISAILWTDGLVAMCFETYQTIEVVLNLIATISTLCAIYGLGLFYEMSIRPLRKFYVRPKFFGMKILLLLTNVQAAIFAFLNRFGVIGCLSPLPCDSEFTGNVILNAIVAIEMPFLLVIARIIALKFVQRFHKLEQELSVSMATLETNAAPMAEEMCSRDQVRSSNDVRITSIPYSPPSSPELPAEITDEIKEETKEELKKEAESIIMEEIMKEVNKTMENGGVHTSTLEKRGNRDSIC